MDCAASLLRSFVAEPDVEIGIVRVTADGGQCSQTETPQSPISDGGNTITVESVGVFPPRQF